MQDLVGADNNRTSVKFQVPDERNRSAVAFPRQVFNQQHLPD